MNHSEKHLNSTSSVRASSRKNRVYVFREFLIGTFGDRYLKEGDVILDVAGGKGDLSWLLLNVDGFNPVIMDPRSVASTSHIVRSVKWLHEHPLETQARAIPSQPTHQPLAGLMPQLMNKLQHRILQQQAARPGQEIQNGIIYKDFMEPDHIQACLDAEFVEAVKCAKKQQECIQNFSVHDSGPEVWKSFWDDRQNLSRKTKSTTSSLSVNALLHSESFLPKQLQRTSTKNLVRDSAKAWDILQSVRLVVGFHPDQATDACLDLAILLNVPVCIVPCCVFPSEFPDRQLMTGGGEDDGETTMCPVRDYNQLIQYLQLKQPNLRTERLAFHNTETSRNLVLYNLPEDVIRHDKDLVE